MWSSPPSPRKPASTWLRPTHAYTHAFREVDAQLSARERVVANLLLTEGRTA